MTAAHTQTHYAPNPPQLEEPWLKALFAVAITLIALIVIGS